MKIITEKIIHDYVNKMCANKYFKCLKQNMNIIEI
jgi:hypothetical protein